MMIESLGNCVSSNVSGYVSAAMQRRNTVSESTRDAASTIGASTLTTPTRADAFLESMKDARNILESTYGEAAKANRAACGNDQTKLRDYIWDKYYNPKSPRYVKGDFADFERHAMFSNEYAATTGGGFGCDFLDPAFGRAGYSVSIEDGFHRNRAVMNEQLKSIFDANGINIPNGTKLTFTVEPNDFRLSVSGTDDKALRELIESVLNKDGNARQLFRHIQWSVFSASEQMTPDQQRKFNLRNSVLEVMGLDLRYLEAKDGDFYTTDGKSVSDLFRQNVRAAGYDPVTAGFYTNHVTEGLAWLAQKGYDSIPDMVLQAEWLNGSLYDMYQAEQYGEPNTLRWLARQRGVDILA